MDIEKERDLRSELVSNKDFAPLRMHLRCTQNGQIKDGKGSEQKCHLKHFYGLRIEKGKQVTYSGTDF